MRSALHCVSADGATTSPARSHGEAAPLTLLGTYKPHSGAVTAAYMIQDASGATHCKARLCQVFGECQGKRTLQYASPCLLRECVYTVTMFTYVAGLQPLVHSEVQTQAPCLHVIAAQSLLQWQVPTAVPTSFHYVSLQTLVLTVLSPAGNLEVITAGMDKCLSHYHIQVTAVTT